MAAGYLRLHFLWFAPIFLLEALFSWLRVTGRPGMFLAGSLLRLGVTIVGVVTLLAALKLRIWGMLWTTTAAIALTALFLVVYCFRVQRPTFDFRVFGRMAKFGAPVGLSWLTMFIINSGDRFILSQYRIFSDMGLYDLAYKFAILFSATYGSFSQYWSAQVFVVMKRDDSDDVFARLSTYVFLGASFFALALIVASRPALTIFAAPAYRRAADLVPILVAAYYINALSHFLKCLFLAAGRPGYEATVNGIGAVVCLAGYFLLIPTHGIWGAAIATIIAFLVIGAISVVWTYRLCRYRVEGARLVKVAIAGAAGLTLHWTTPHSTLGWQIAAAAISVSAFPLTLLILGFPSSGEKRTGWAALQSLAGRWTGFSTLPGAVAIHPTLRLLKGAALKTADSWGVSRMVANSRWRQKRLLILGYHGLSLRDEHDWRPLFMRPAFFYRRLEILAQGGYRVLPLEAALGMLREGRLPPKSVAITFDDGFQDFHQLAFPRLREFGFPATVYQCTYYCDQPFPVFNLVLSYLLWRGSGRRLNGVACGLHETFGLATEEERTRAVDSILDFVRQQHYSAAARNELAARVAADLDVDYAEILRLRMLRLMTPAQLSEIRAGGMDVQLHSHRHRPPADALSFASDIRDNRAWLTLNTGARPSHFCYPGGAYRREALPWLRSEQIVSATTCDPGLATRACEPLLLPRLLDTMSTTEDVFRGWLTGAASFLPQWQRAEDF